MARQSETLRTIYDHLREQKRLKINEKIFTDQGKFQFVFKIRNEDTKFSFVLVGYINILKPFWSFLKIVYAHVMTKKDTPNRQRTFSQQ